MSVSSGVKYTVIDRKFNVADELIQAMELQALQQRVSYSCDRQCTVMPWTGLV